MISYRKLFELMKEKGKNTSHIRNDNIIGQETLRKLKLGTVFLRNIIIRFRAQNQPNTKKEPVKHPLTVNLLKLSASG